MRHVLFTMLVALFVAPLCALSACGGGSGGGSGDPEAARAVLITVLDAARRGDFAAARPHLDVIEMLAANDHPKAATYPDLPKPEQEELGQSCFNAVTGAMRVLTLPDQASISTAVRGGTLQHESQLKAVQIRFQAPDAERAGRQLAVDVKLRYGMDRVWRVAAIKVDL